MRNRLRVMRTRRAVLLAVAVTSLAVGAGVGTMTAPGAGSDEGPAGTERAQWEKIASGTDSQFGRYELFRATVDGQNCVGLNLVDQNSPAVARAISSICATDPLLEVAFVRGEPGTLAWGLTSAETQSVTLGGAGQADRDGRVISAGGNRIVMASNPRRFARARVRAVRGDGSTVAVRDAAE